MKHKKSYPEIGSTSRWVVMVFSAVGEPCKIRLERANASRVLIVIHWEAINFSCLTLIKNAKKSGPKAALKININQSFYLLITFTVLMFPSA